MAEDISTLVLQVKSDGIKEGTDQLNALTEAAAKAEGAAKKLGTEVAQTEAVTKRSSGSAKAFAEAEDAATRAVGAAVTAYQRKAVEQKRQIEMYNLSGRAYAAAQADAIRLNNAMDKSSVAFDKMWSSAHRMNAEFDKRTAVKAAADFEKMWNEAERMNKAFDNSVQAYGRMQAKANEMNRVYDENKNAVDKNTGAHGSNAGAIREVMVLMHELSQGSYKRFGGSLMVLSNQLDLIPKAMDFIKSSSVGTIASFTAVGIGIAAIVAGVGMLVVGAIQGAREWKHFNDALIMTGNYAGTSADGLHSMAVAAASTGGSIGNAKEAVTLLAASGKFAASEITGIAKAATLMEEAFGVAVEETAKEYETLATLAVTSTARSNNVITQHVMKMNDHYHALTAAQIEQISQLEKEGKAIEAVKLATTLLATEQSRRADESIEKLGYVARAWHGIKTAMSAVMDGIGNWGAKDDSLEGQLKAMRKAKAEQERLQVTEWARKQSNANFDKAIADIEQKIRDKAAADAKVGADKQLDQDRAHASERFRVIVEANDKEAKKKRELSELERDYFIHDKAWQLEHAKEYEKAKAKIEADALDKAPKGNDTRTVDRDTEIDNLKAANRVKLDEIDGFITLSKERARKEDANRWAELDERKAYYAEEHKVLEASLNKELAVYDAFAKQGNHTPREKAANERKREAAQNDYNIKDTSLKREERKDVEDVYAAEAQELDKLEAKYDKAYQAESKRIAELVKSERIRLAGINALKSAKMDAQAGEEDKQADELQHEYDIRAGIVQLMEDAGLWTGRRASIEEAGLASLKKEIDGRRELANLHRQEAGQQRKVEDFQRTTKYLDAAISAGKRFEKSLTSAFGNVGKAIGGMSTAFLQMLKDKNDAQAYYNSLSKDEQDSEAAKAALASKNTDATISGYANMADAAKGFFSEKSRGYQIAEGISRAFHIAELARNGIQMISNLATGASKFFAQSGWGGFAGVAAMAATMAAFGISVATSRSDSGQSAAEVQKTQGTGTVFGDSSAKSSSISKSIDILKDNSNVMLPVNQAMLASLQSIQASMSGLTNLVLRTNGVTSGSNMGIQTGTLSRTGQAGISSFLMGTNAMGGAAGGAMIGSLFGPLGTALGALGGALVGKIASFWGKTTQEITDSGLMFGGKVSALQGGQGFDQYANVKTTKSSWFGLSKDSSSSIKTQGLNDELSQQFGLVFSNLETTLKLAAGSLGKDSGEVGKAIENMVLDTTKVSLKDLKGDDLTNAINAVMSKAMDQIAEEAFPALDSFRQVGEGYSETVIRVASGIQSADAALERFGITAVNFNDIINKQGDVSVEITKQSISAVEGLSGVNAIIQDMSGSLSDLTSMYGSLLSIRKAMKSVGLGTNLDINILKGAGGVSELSTALSTYQDKYFTSQEKAAIMVKSLTEDFGKLGYQLPASKNALRALITSIGTATPEASKLTGELLGMSSSYSDMIDAITDANSNATDSLNTTIDSLKTFSDALKSLKSSLLLGDLSTLTPTEKYLEAKKEYEDTVSKAMKGDTVAQGNVSSVSQAYLEAARTVFASSPEYSKAFSEVQADIDKMSTYTDTQLTESQKQLDALSQSTASLTALTTSVDTLNTTVGSLDTSLTTTTAPTALTAAAPVVDLSALEAQVETLRKQLADAQEANVAQINNLIAAVYDAEAKGADAMSDSFKDSSSIAAWAAEAKAKLLKR